jgi:peptide-methionine (S)-S-oxide reductase
MPDLPAVPPLLQAVRAGDLRRVRQLLSEGENPRAGDDREAPLHAAARRGPLALVETLIAGGALDWVRDAAGRTPLEVARRERPRERDAILALLDRDAIPDASFRAAVAAIHAGDVAALERLLDAEPRLLRERIVGPEAYRVAPRKGYFVDPRLFWFVANNPTLVNPTPPNATEIAAAMIRRGVEQDDLDYTLGLVTTGSPAHAPGQQRALMRVLIDAGAVATPETIVSTAAHWQLDALRALLEFGYPLTAPIAAALGEVASLPALLAANPGDVQNAFGLAVINRNLEAARLALDAGADAGAFLPTHSHSTALHQAAIHDDVEMIELLVAHGARQDVRDTLWGDTPLGWAIHENRPAARARLEAAAAGD